MKIVVVCIYTFKILFHYNFYKILSSATNKKLLEKLNTKLCGLDLFKIYFLSMYSQCELVSTNKGDVPVRK